MFTYKDKYIKKTKSVYQLVDTSSDSCVYIINFVEIERNGGRNCKKCSNSSLLLKNKSRWKKSLHFWVTKIISITRFYTLLFFDFILLFYLFWSIFKKIMNIKYKINLFENNFEIHALNNLDTYIKKTFLHKTYQTVLTEENSNYGNI